MASLQFWIALLFVMLMGCIFNVFVAILSYNMIVLPRRRQHHSYQRNSKKDGDTTNDDQRTMTHFLFGFGVIMPLSAIYPYYCIPFFGVKNKVLKFFFGVQSLTTFFRCSEGTCEFFDVELVHMELAFTFVTVLTTEKPCLGICQNTWRIHYTTRLLTTCSPWSASLTPTAHL